MWKYEFAKKYEEERKKVPEDYRRFVYIEPDTVSSVLFNQESSTPESLVSELQIVQTEPQQLSDTTEQVSTESESTELIYTEPEHQEFEVQKDNNEIHSRVKEPVLAKYVRRHHSAD